MLFSRRKRAAAAASAPASNGTAPRGHAEAGGQTDDAVVGALLPTRPPTVAPSIDSPTAADTAPQPVIAIEPVVSPAPLPSVAPPSIESPAAVDTAPPRAWYPSPQDPGSRLEPVAPTPIGVGVPPPPGEEPGVADLDEFFAALRQVVDDSLARMPLESDRPAPQPFDEAEPLESDPEAVAEHRDQARADGAPGGPAGQPEHAIGPGEDRPGEMVLSTNGSQLSTELAPTTAELIAALEADRDRWRERAIVWRERAMGADMLVNSLNDHMAALRVNLEDLRMAIRVMSSATPGSKSASETRPAVASSPLRDDGERSRPRRDPPTSEWSSARESSSLRPKVDRLGQPVLDRAQIVDRHIQRRPLLDLRADRDPMPAQVDLRFTGPSCGRQLLQSSRKRRRDGAGGLPKSDDRSAHAWLTGSGTWRETVAPAPPDAADARRPPSARFRSSRRARARPTQNRNACGVIPNVGAIILMDAIRVRRFASASNTCRTASSRTSTGTGSPHATRTVTRLPLL